MSSQQNTFRLGRLSHTSDFRKHSVSEYNNNPKDTLKLAALTSINRGVKYNDLSFITGRELPKLRKEPEQGDNLEYGSAHEALTSIRKKCDNVNKQKLQTESKIKLLKEEKQKYEISQSEFLDNKGQGSGKVKNLQDELNRIKGEYEDSEWTKKSYQMLARRIRSDKVVYDQRKYGLEKELEHLRKQMNIFDREGTGVHEETDRTAKVYEKLVRQLQNEEDERGAHLESLGRRLLEKEQIDQQTTERKRETSEIAAKAMQDKDENEKNWVKILHVHKVVDGLLRSKMAREMEKFSVVEAAFKTIKIATGVSDTQTLIHKYLNAEQNYGELLSKIADNEKKIEELKAEKEQLLRGKKQLKAEKEVHQFAKREEVNLRGPIKEFEELSLKLETSRLNTERVRQWIAKNSKKIHNIDSRVESIAPERELPKIGENFKVYLTNLGNLVEKCEEEAKNSTSQSTKEDSLHADAKLFRIKPKVRKVNSSGEEIENQFEEEELPNPGEQEEIVSNQRAEVIRHNEKFMKELKKKTDEIRKAKIEAEMKTKAKEPEKKPVKQNEDED